MTITNPFAQEVEGTVPMIGPVETWSMHEVNPISLLVISPWKQAFEVPVFGTKTIYYEVKPNIDYPMKVGEMWLVAKLAYFGYVEYNPALGDLVIKN